MISSVLESETDSYTKEVEQQGMMRKLWVTYPVAANELVKLQDKSFDKDWFDALSFELRVRNAEFPVMPEYGIIHFVVLSNYQDIQCLKGCSSRQISCFVVN